MDQSAACAEGCLIFTINAAPPLRAEADKKKAPDHRFLDGDRELFAFRTMNMVNERFF